jgi:hypothetical protein
MKPAVVLVSGIALGASVAYLLSGYKKPVLVKESEAIKKKKMKRIVGFSALGLGVVLIGVAVKTKAFSK